MNFSPGNNVFIGENGAGKSSTLNQILMCLYGHRPADKKFADLLRRGTKKTMLHLSFQGQDGLVYCIDKEFSKSGDRKHILYPQTNSNEILGEKVSGVQKEVNTRLGISESTFKDIVYAQQGEIQKIGDSKGRKSLFDRLLGFDRFGTASSNLSGIIRDSKKSEENAQKDKDEYEPATKKLPEKEMKLTGKQEELTSLQDKNTNLTYQITEQQKRLEKLRPLKEAFDNLNENIRRQNDHLIIIDGQIQQNRQELESNLNKRLEAITLERLQGMLDEWDSSVQILVKTIEEEDSKRKFLKEKEKEFNVQEKELNNSQTQWITTIKSQNVIKKDFLQLADFELKEDQIETQVQTWKKDVDTLKGKIEVDETRCNFLRAKRERMKDIEKNIRNAELNLEITEGHVEKAENDIFTKVPEIQTKSREEKLEYAEDFERQKLFLFNRAKKFSSGVGASTVALSILLLLIQPLLGFLSLIGGIGLSAIIFIFLGPYPMKQRKKNIPPLVIDLRTHEDSADTQKDLIIQLKDDRDEFADYDWSEIDRLEEALQNNRESLNVTNRLVILSQDAQANFRTLKIVHNDIEDCFSRILNIFKTFPLEDYQYAKNTTENLHTINIEDWQLSEINFYNWIEIDELEERIKENCEKQNTTQQHIKYGETLKNDFLNYNEKEAKLQEYQEELHSLCKKYTLGEFETTEEKIQELKQNLLEITTRIRGLVEETIPALEIIVDNLKEEVRRYWVAVKEEKRASEILSLSTILRDMYQEIPRILRQNNVDLISRHATDLLRELDPESDISEIQIDIDYNVNIRRFGDLEELHVLSGGESVIVCLAIRLAFIRTLSTCDIAILDEPTAHLDKNRVQELVRVLSQERPIHQLFVVTHDPEFEQVGDTVYRVWKDHGVTKVERSV